MKKDEELKREIARGREFLKAHDWRRWEGLQTDQQREVPIPPFQKPLPADVDPANLLELPAPAELELGSMPLREAVDNRRSRRRFSDEALSLGELSFLLWATQGLRRVVNGWSFRTVPSAGSRHPCETYLLIERVEGLTKGLYRFLPEGHRLLRVKEGPGLRRRAVLALVGQDFNPAATFFWTAVPYRMEWRYAAASAKIIALDAGHVCQNLYLACEALGCGTCAVGAYDQARADDLLGVDGEDEFTVYAAPVGRPLRQGD